MEHAQAKLEVLSNLSPITGLKIHKKKTKNMRIQRTPPIVASRKDLEEAKLQHPCPYCNHKFPTVLGLRIHQSRKACDPNKKQNFPKNGLAYKKVTRNNEMKYRAEAPPQILVHGTPIENTASEKYLGNFFSADNNQEDRYGPRLAQAITALCKLKPILIKE